MSGLFSMFPVFDVEEDDDMNYALQARGLTESRNQMARLMRDASRKAHLYDQDEIWVNAEGRYIPIREISARYAENIMRHLESSVMEDAEMVYFWMTREEMSPAEFNWDRDRCIEWLQGTELYLSLKNASERPF